MNLQDITTKAWILALFKRDDGERFLLGDGYYDFKESLQHFSANSIANDIVELQGADGQLLAGQVKRATTQSFDGFIGDGLTSKAEVEFRRRAFLQFFQVRHFYDVIYVFCDGTSIIRKRGFLVDAPEVPEIRQMSPSYHVALNFEDANYYEYAEDGLGDEIFANTVKVAFSNAITGGLVWDEDGAVSNNFQIIYSDQISASGNPISFSIDTEYGGKIEELKLNGNATQNGTPTPDYPQDVNVVTGAQNVEVVGKNLFGGLNIASVTYCTASLDGTTLTVTPNDTTHNTAVYLSLGTKILAGTYTFNSSTFISNASQLRNAAGSIVHNFGNGYLNKTFTLTETATVITFNWYSTGSTTPFTVDLSTLQIELGNSASSYESYQGASYEVNLGKNLLDPSTLDQRVFENDLTNNYYYDANLHFALKAGETYTLSAYVEQVGSTPYKLSALIGTANAATAELGTVQNLTTVGDRVSVTFSVSEAQITSAGGNNLFMHLPRYASPTTTHYKIKDIQLELGSQATSYAPYFTPIELAKIGTYQDYIWNDGGTWKVHKALGKQVLSSSDNITLASSYTNIEYGQVPKPSDATFYNNNYPSPDTSIASFATYGNAPNGYDSADNIGQYILKALTARYFVGFAKGTGIDAIKAALNGQVMYYALATPTDTAITDQTLIDQLNAVANAQLYSGQNNIMNIAFSPNLAGELEIGYVEMEGYDYTDSGYVFEEGTGGGATTIYVQGIADALPVWVVNGEVTNPTLTNVTTGQSITWTGTVPAGQSLTIDMENQTATLAGANVFSGISGDWVELKVGTNMMTYYANGDDIKPSQLNWSGVVG